MYLLSLSGGVSARVAFAACQEKKYRIRRYMRQIRFWEVKASWIFLYSLLCQFSNMIPGLKSRPSVSCSSPSKTSVPKGK